MPSKDSYFQRKDEQLMGDFQHNRKKRRMGWIAAGVVVSLAIAGSAALIVWGGNYVSPSTWTENDQSSTKE